MTTRTPTIRAEVQRARRDAGELTTMEAVRWTVAEKYAAIADRAARAEDDRALTSALESLEHILSRLSPAGELSGGGDGGGDPRGRVVGILDGAPTVAHSADAG